MCANSKPILEIVYQKIKKVLTAFSILNKPDTFITFKILINKAM